MATKSLFKAHKAEAHSSTLARLQEFTENGKLLPQEMESLYKSQPAKIRKLLDNLVSIYAQGDKKKAEHLKNDFAKWFEKIQSMQDASGANVIQQLQALYTKKSQAYADIAILRTLSAKIEHQESPISIGEQVAMLSPKTKELLKIKDESALDLKAIHSNVSAAIDTITRNTIEPIDMAFDEILNKTEDELAIYEVSAERLADKFSPEVLKRPIDVTMVGVEFSGFVKEGGRSKG